MKAQDKLKAVEAYREYVNTFGEAVTGDQRRIIQGNLMSEKSEYRKTASEKEFLKIEKAQAKRDEMRK